MDKPVKISPQKQNLKFQIIDWKSGDTNSKFEIQLFGVTKSGQSVTAFVKNFEPCFFIEIPDDSETDYAKFVRKLSMDMGDMSGYLKKHETVRKEKYFGYHAHKKYRFLKLVFSTEFARKKVISIIRQKYQRKLRIKCYESNLEPFLKFGHIQNIQFCGWVKINKTKYTISDREANTQLVIDVDWAYVKNYDSNEIAPIRIASFDLECISATNQFPKPENAEDHIIQIGTSVLEYSTNETWKVMFSLNECDPIDNVEVVSVQNEHDLICKWAEWIKRVDADILTGYNIFGFDYHYLYHRAKLLGCEEELLSIGRLCDKDDQYVEKELSSSALGKNHLKYMNINGRVSIDLFKILQRDHKLDSYKLNFVAEHFTGQTKHDVTPNQIFEYQRKDSAHRKIVAEYCVQDCDLVIWLFQKLDIVPCNKGLADVSSVPLSYIILRGQGIKAFSLLAKECMNKGYLIEDRPRGFGAQEDNKYLGAIVLEPQKGAYLDMPVVCNDFASLYPSSIISHNLSPNTHIFDKKYLSSSDEIEVIEWEEGQDEDASVGTVHHEFVKPKDDSDRGILPNILIFLLKVRKQTKKMMSQAETEDKRSVLNGLQLAYKITANSLYGQMGAVVSPVYYKAVASCTTAVGRSLLLKARDCVLKEIPGTEAVYGDTDSVFFQFPINVDSSDKKKLEEAERFGQLAEKKVNAILPYPHNFEYEKIMFPFILLTKKRYCGMKYEGDIQNPKFNAMGMALKRRDFCKVTKHILGGAIDILMTKKSVEEAADFVKENVKKTLDGEFPLDYFVLTRELRSENYKNPEAMPHYQLVLKMRERNPGIQISTSERIRMVMKLVPDAGRKNILQSQIVEDPDYLVENNERVDYRWYITNQLRKQIIEIFSILMEDPQDILDPILKEDMIVRKRIMAKMNKEIDEINRKNKNHSITNFFRVKNT